MIFYGSIKQKWLLKALHNGYNSGGHQSSTQVLNDVKVIPYNAIKHLLSIKRGCLFQPL